jgi:choline monooxygenase
MNLRSLDIDPDIRRASTLPAEVYCEPAWFAAQKERLFARTWHLVGDAKDVAQPGEVRPHVLLDGCLDEPLFTSRDESGELHCLSNVCTHRGNLLVEEATCTRTLRCRYHGRRFGLDGRFLSMPQFERAADFPRPEDNLPHVPCAEWKRLLFASLAPAVRFDSLIDPVRSRMEWFALENAVLDPATSRDYVVHANWALYCDNYLEGFHIPYLHAALNDALEYRAYRTETLDEVSLQIGIAPTSDGAFALPREHPDREMNVAAYYFFLFPATMLNFYPWGVSINIVLPEAVDRTRVRFLSYVVDPARRMTGAGADLHRVELEDEAVVQSVQRGVRSRLYERGRYSPEMEIGVHHFHRLLARYLAGE